MAESTTAFFPDVNVWLALTHDRHVHHVIASDWFSDEGGNAHFFFCRLTQLGLVRLLTQEAVMGQDVMSQVQGWEVFDRCLRDDRVEFLDEPTGLDPRFRHATRSRRPAPKDWTDVYLAGFAGAGELTSSPSTARCGRLPDR